MATQSLGDLIGPMQPTLGTIMKDKLGNSMVMVAPPGANLIVSSIFQPTIKMVEKKDRKMRKRPMPPEHPISPGNA